MKKAWIYKTKLGRFLIAQNSQGISHLELLADEWEESSAEQYEWVETELLQETAHQLTEYLDSERKEFTVPLYPDGTEFQKKVWKALIEIPYGQTKTYQQIAEAVGSHKAARAVGMANHNNPIMIMVPCHRVIGANGKLVGYAGGLDMKKTLLDLEQGRKKSYE